MILSSVLIVPYKFILPLKATGVLKIFSSQDWIINTSHKHPLKKLKFHLFEDFDIGGNKSN